MNIWEAKFSLEQWYIIGSNMELQPPGDYFLTTNGMLDVSYELK
jgi:hypothetical protein